MERRANGPGSRGGAEQPGIDARGAERLCRASEDVDARGVDAERVVALRDGQAQDRRERRRARDEARGEDLVCEELVDEQVEVVLRHSPLAWYYRRIYAYEAHLLGQLSVGVVCVGAGGGVGADGPVTPAAA